MKISVRSWNLGLPMYEGIEAAGKMGLDGIALWYSEDFAWLDKIKADNGESILSACEKAGLEICAITGGLGSFADPVHRPVAMQKARHELEVCGILDVPRITSHVGVMPADLSTPEAEAMMESLRIIGDEAAVMGKVIGCETGPEDAQTMLNFIEAVDSEGLVVNYDPANFHLGGFDWFEGVALFGELIDHTHAKDAKKNPDGSTEQTPIGEGDIDFRKWIDALREIGFDGWLCIERESGDDRLGDIERGMNYLRELI